MGKRNPSTGKRIKGRLESNEFASRLIGDARYRIFVCAVCGLLFNVIFAVFNAAVGWLGNSPWFGTLAAYYILLSMMRSYWLTGTRREKYQAGCGRHEYKRRKLCLLYGILFCFMAVVLGGAVVLLLNREGGKEYPGLVIYAVATYTFCKIVFAVINMVRARKRKTLALMIIRDVGCVDACVSILSLQTGMLSAFGGAGREQAFFAQTMNGATGAAVCLIILTLGVYYLRMPKFLRSFGFGWNRRQPDVRQREQRTVGEQGRNKAAERNGGREDDTYPCCRRR